jgi:GMP synthase-like glutamine amidotransferase
MPERRAPLGPVACIVNQPDAHLGRLRPLLDRVGVPVIEVLAARDLGELSLDEIGGLIVLGGEMGVHDSALYPFLADEVALLAGAHERGLPVLGLCLGAQLLAAALGAEVRARRCSEIGWLEVSHLVEDPVLGPPGRRRQFQWHYDSFELPAGANRLASSSKCPNQAFRIGRSYGLQFHPEASAEIVEGWALSAKGRAELVANGVNPGELVAEAKQLDAAYDRQANAIVAGFSGLVGRSAQQER